MESEIVQIVKESLTEKAIWLAGTLKGGIFGSKHILKGGDVGLYFIDFDLLSMEPYKCKVIGESFRDKIFSLQFNRGKFDLLAFIEKEGIGTNGLIRFAAYLSVLTEIPHFLIRLSKDIPCDRIKISKESSSYDIDRLEGKRILLLSDVSTTGKELKSAIKEIRENGGNHIEILLYFSRLTRRKLKELCTTNDTIVHYLLDEITARKKAIIEPEKYPELVKLFQEMDDEEKDVIWEEEPDDILVVQRSM